jgi:hypothetical protein
VAPTKAAGEQEAAAVETTALRPASGKIVHGTNVFCFAWWEEAATVQVRKDALFRSGGEKGFTRIAFHSRLHQGCYLRTIRKMSK